ncbi:MAG: hypothetical protein ACTHK8_09740 [Ginsengibacter sp.]
MKDFIRQTLSTMLVNLNPAIDKRDFKKSIEKAEKILFKGATKKRKKNKSIQIDYKEQVVIATTSNE